MSLAKYMRLIFLHFSFFFILCMSVAAHASEEIVCQSLFQNKNAKPSIQDFVKSHRDYWSESGLQNTTWPSYLKIRYMYWNSRGEELPKNEFLQISLPEKSQWETAATDLAKHFKVPASAFIKLFNEARGEWVPIGSVIPSFIRRTVGGRNHCFANCWNAALRYHNNAFLPIYTPEFVATYRLKELYDPVDLRKEKMQFGDLIAVWRVYYENGDVQVEELIHFAIYIGGDIVFQKDGLDYEGYYEFATFGSAGVASGTGGYNGQMSVYRPK